MRPSVVPPVVEQQPPYMLPAEAMQQMQMQGYDQFMSPNGNPAMFEDVQRYQPMQAPYGVLSSPKTN